MLTIRHIEYPNTTNQGEQIFEARSVHYSLTHGPDGLRDVPFDHQCNAQCRRAVECETGIKDTLEGRARTTVILMTGRVYVMNEAGKTVAKYDFDVPVMPNREMPSHV